MFTQTTHEVCLAEGGTMIVEKDVAISMRDGAILYADVFRPKGGERVPVLINISCYQKDKVWVPPPDLEEKPRSVPQLGDGDAELVDAARLCRRAGGHPRLRKISRVIGSRILAGSAGFLRCDRMVGEAGLVQWQRRHGGRLSYHARLHSGRSRRRTVREWMQ